MSFADPIETTRAYLNFRAAEASTALPCYGGVPTPAPSRFVRLQRVGSSRWSVAHRDVRIVAECWNSSGEVAADADGELVASWIADLNTTAGRVPQGEAGWVGGPYPQPDPDTGTPRSVMTFILRQRSQA